MSPSVCLDRPLQTSFLAASFAAFSRASLARISEKLELHLAVEHVLRRPLVRERNLWRHRPFGFHAAHGDRQRPERVLERRVGRGRLVAAMRHAVRAFLITAGAVRIPIGRLHQLLERLGIAFAEQIAGFLPAEDIARGHAPRRAVEFLIAGEEVEEHARMSEIPLLALAQREDLAEQLLGLAARQEVLLIGSAL